MTITLELTADQELRLQERARALGLAPQEYLIRSIDGPSPAYESLGDRLRRLGALGAFESMPRPDGRPWSEVEGFE